MVCFCFYFQSVDHGQDEDDAVYDGADLELDTVQTEKPKNIDR